VISFNISADSVTGVVAAAALSASLALRVLQTVLEVSARKQDSERLRGLIEAAGQGAERLVTLAAEDGAAYAAYMQARRERNPHVQAALRRAIESPLAAARASAGGIDVCMEAVGYTRGAIAADVSGAAALLAGAVRAILCSLDANLQALDDEVFAREMAAEGRRLEMHAIRQAGGVLTAVKTASNSDWIVPPA
jgi:formiminotetrahydrofolate cyclodeaminase